MLNPSIPTVTGRRQVSGLSHYPLPALCDGGAVRPRRPGIRPLVLAALLASGPLQADVWVLEPTLGFDQRLDDNYRLDALADENVSATRVVGRLGLSRESQTVIMRGLLQADGVLTFRDGRDDQQLESNQSAEFEATFKGQRYTYGSGFRFTQDKPTQEISVNLTDGSAVAIDTGENADTRKNVDRRRIELTPNFSYELTRRHSIDARLSYTDVSHGLTDPQDALIDRYVSFLQSTNRPPGFNPDIPLDQLTFDDVPTPFTYGGELDDFREGRIDVGWSYRLSPISAVSLNAGYIDYRADTEADPSVIFDFLDKEEDPDQKLVLRDPKRESLSDTTRLTVGYERDFSPTLSLQLEVGGFVKNTDDSDLLRPDDQTSLGPDDLAERRAGLQRQEEGWLANVMLTQLTRRSRYEGRLAFDLSPSDTGREEQALDLRLGVQRELTPRLNAGFQLRAYDPDFNNAALDDKYKRRFLSLEPRVNYALSRDWSVSLSYLYRRQRSLVEFSSITPTGEVDSNGVPVFSETVTSEFLSGDSNAILLSLRYAPPSPIKTLRNTF